MIKWLSSSSSFSSSSSSLSYSILYITTATVTLGVASLSNEAVLPHKKNSSWFFNQKVLVVLALHPCHLLYLE